MTKVLLCTAIAILFTGCNGIDGNMDIHTNFDLAQNGKALLHLTEGRQKAKIEINERRRDYKFKIKLEDGQKATFNIDKTDDIPNNGDFFFSAEETGLNADLAGQVRTNKTISGPYRDQESCTYTDYRRVCYIEDGRDGRRRRVCRTEPYQRHGWQRVEYDIERTQIDVDLEINTNAGESQIADFMGQTTYSEKRYRYVDQCF